MHKLKKAFQFWFWETPRTATKAAYMKVKNLGLIGPGLVVSTIIGVGLFFIFREDADSAIEELYTFGAFVVAPAVITFGLLFLYEYFCAPAQLLEDWHFAHGLKQMGEIVIDLRRKLYSIKAKCEAGENVSDIFSEWKLEVNQRLEHFPPIFMSRFDDDSMGGMNMIVDAHSAGANMFKHKTGYGREPEIEVLLSAIRKKEYAMDMMISDISQAQLRHLKDNG